MKVKLLLTSILATLIISMSYSQGVNNKSINFKTMLTPVVPVKDVSTIGLKVHQGANGSLTDHAFKVNKLKNAAENNGQDAKRYAYADYTISDASSDLTFEIAFAPISNKAEKEMYTYKAPCVLDDGKLDKEDIMECDAYAYKQSFSLPTILRAVDKTGKVVFAEKFDKEIFTKYGESDLSPFLKKADLIASYTQNGGKLEGIAYNERLDECLDRIGEVLYFMEYTDGFNIGTGKGKDMDYSKQEEAQNIAIETFKVKNQTDFSALNGAVAIWEEELKGLDMGNKEAKISRKVATVLYENLAVSYMYLHNFDKAIENVLEFRRLSKMAANQAIGDRAAWLQRRIFNYKRSFELNGDITVGEDAKKAKDFKVFVSENRSGKSFLSNTEKYAAFEADVAKMEAEEAALNAKDNEAVTEAASKDNPYRNQITNTATQGNMLIMNSFTHSSLKGKAMPDEVADLIELNQLSTFNMEFTSLPKNIGNLKELTLLKLKGSHLTEVPESIGGLTKLKTLDLSGNKLTTLPESIKNCTSLNSLKLKDNNISADELAKIIGWLPKKCKVK